MTFADYFLLSIFYFWASSTALSLGIGYYTIYRPVMAGMIAGLILKDAQKGMMAGAVVNIIYIDFVSTGGSFKGDQCLTAILAAMASILFNLHPLEASALAYPFGFLGILIWKYRLKINNVFVHIYEKKYKDKKNSVWLCTASDISYLLS
jgi:mannose/fructose/N-acetylgalactosamine-specific phosphotransferase system component IIC